MLVWIALKEILDKAMAPIFVNIEQVSSIQRVDNHTVVWFLAGHPKGKIEVREKPEDIFQQLRIAVPPNLLDKT